MLNYLELIGKLINVPSQELIANLTKNGEGNELIEEAEVKTFLENAFSNKINTVGTDNLKRGKREALTALEKSIRSKFNVSSQAQGIDLVDLVVNSQLEAAKAGNNPTNPPKTDNLTLESIKKLPIYQSLVDSIKNPFEERYFNLEKEYNTFKTEQLTNQKRAIAYKMATQILDKHKAILGEGETRNKRVNFFNNSIPLDRLQISEVEGKPQVTVLDANGNKMVDRYQTPISYEQFIKDLNPYGFHKHDPSKSGTGGEGGIGGGTGGSSTVFKTDAEFLQHINSSKMTPAERQQALKDYQASKQKT